MESGGLIILLSTFLAPVSDNVPGIRCRNHSLEYMKALNAGTKWATRMWDSTAKLQTGLLTGNLNSLGNYDECIDIQAGGSDGDKFRGQYCLARFDLDNTTLDDALGILFKQVIKTEEEINVGLGNLLSKGLHWGYCIPSSCTSKDLAIGLNNFLTHRLRGINISVHSSDCTYDKGLERPFSTEDFIAVIFFTLLFILIVASSFYDCLNVFALFGNWTDSYESAEGQTAERPTAVGSQIQTEGATGRLSPEGASEGFSRVSSTTEGTSGGMSRVSSETGTSSTARSERSLLAKIPAPRNSPQIDSSIEIQTIQQRTDSPNPPPRRRRRPRCDWKSPDVSPVQEPTLFESRVYSSFSIFSNGSRLFSLRCKRYSLKSLDGIKVLSLCWVILGQSYFVTSSLPAINYISITEITNKWPTMLILNTQLAIDSFIVCTGVLTSYNFLRDMKKREIKTKLTNLKDRVKFFYRYLPIYYLHRYIRLTPAIATMILIQISVIDHLGSGPFWGTGNGYMSRICHDSWWGTLLYVQNYVDPMRMCLPHSWYMMVDMQLYLISPILLLSFLYTSKMKAILISCGIAYLGMMCTFLISYFLYIPAGVLPESLEAWHLKTKYEYVTAYTRLAPWVIGMITGYLLYYFRQKERTQPSMKTWHLCICWSIAPLLLGYSIFGLLPFQQHGDEGRTLVSSLFNSVFRSFWALGVAWIIAACETNHGGIVQKILSIKVFRPLSRLTYCLYLVHLPLMTYRALMIRVPIHIDTVTGLSFIFGDFTASLHYAIFLSLFVEIPILRLFKTLLLQRNCPVRATLPPAGHEDETEEQSSGEDTPTDANIFQFSSSPTPSRLILTQPLLGPEPEERPRENTPLARKFQGAYRFFTRKYGSTSATNRRSSAATAPVSPLVASSIQEEAQPNV